MTAEIAILNKHAIAMAADSAVTLSNDKRTKIFKAHKIFSLSKYESIGIMVYGNASFMAVPWETLIKLFRSGLGNKRFDTLNEYCDCFIDF